MSNILENRFFIILISMIWGFGLAILFRKTCQDNQCTIIKAPPKLREQNNIIHDKNDHCYRLYEYPSPCLY